MNDKRTEEQIDEGESRFKNAIIELKKQTEIFYSLVNDPYKAPEQIIGGIPNLHAAMWNANVEYAATQRKQ